MSHCCFTPFSIPLHKLRRQEGTVTDRLNSISKLLVLLVLCLSSMNCREVEERAGATNPQPEAKAAPAAPRGLLLVTIDTLRADHLPSFGYPREITPFLSTLADDGVVFERALSSCSHTAPSHASMFTGLHPPQHQLLENGQPLNERFSTVAERLAERGYRTAAVSTTRFLRGVSRGFETFLSPKQGFGNAEWIVAQGLNWLDTLEPGEPFFLWLHFFDVHEWDHQDRLDRAAGEALRETGGLHGPELVDYLVTEHGNPLEHLGSEQKLLEMINAYDGQILAVDRELGRLHAQLEQAGLGATTAWVVTSDHGEGLGNHGNKGHGRNIYNEQLHVPLVFNLPAGGSQPSRVTETVELIDVGPTLLQLAGTSFDDGREERLGRPLTPLLTGSGAWEKRFAFAVRRPADEFRLGRGWSPGDVFALQERNFKIIVDTAGAVELYDLNADPYEQHRLNEELVRVRQRLERRAGQVFAAMQPRDEAIEDAEIDQAHVDELKALGYL